MTVINGKILAAMQKAQKTVLVHGESGSGKTSMVKQYCEDSNMQLIFQPAPTIDPQALSFPKTNKDGLVESVVSKWFYELTQPVADGFAGRVLLIDEFNRPFHPLLMAMMTQILTERSLYGHKMTDDVLVVGTCNIEEENDTGIDEIPNAVRLRCGHFYWSPSPEQTTEHYSPLAREIALESGVSSLGKSKVTDDLPVFFKGITECPRQFDAACEVIVAGEKSLSDNDVGNIFESFLGTADGVRRYTHYKSLKDKTTDVLSQDITLENMEEFIKYQEGGNVIPLAAYMVEQMKKDNLVPASVFMARHALPEVCAAVMPHNEVEVKVDTAEFMDLINLTDEERRIPFVKVLADNKRSSWFLWAFALKRMELFDVG